MKKMLGIGLAVYAVFACAVVVLAEIDTSDHTYSGKLDFTTASDVRILGGAKLTATSTELNALDGITATVAEINAIDVSASADNGAPGALYSVKVTKTMSGTSTLTNSTTGVTVPDNAIVVSAVLDITTAMVSPSDDGTIALNLMSDGDILAAVDADSLGVTHTNAMTCLFSSPASWIKTTNAMPITITTATHAVTNGTWNLTLFYFMGK